LQIFSTFPQHKKTKGRTMKLALVGLLALPLAGAFTPAATGRAFTLSKISMEKVVTGREGKAATSAEEDLMLTSQIILKHAEKERTSWSILQKVRIFLNNKYLWFFRNRRPNKRGRW
jgi:hypothetical protein